MKYNKLGRTGLEVSRLGFGCIKFREETQKNVTEALNLALDSGINFFDTARGYGPSEEMIGQAIAHRREEFYIATKTKETGYKEAIRDIDISLKNLRTDFIDIYQLHSISNKEKWDKAVNSGRGSLQAMLDAQRAGKIGHIGITIHRSLENMLRATRSEIFETIMLLYNIADEENVGEEILPRASRCGLGTIVMKAVGGGRFAEIYSAQMGNKPVPERDPVVEKCLRFVLANDHVSTVIPGMRNAKEVAENVQTECMKPLEPQEHRELMEMVGERTGLLRYEQRCMQCKYCLPCPEGVEIPKILRTLAFLKSERIDNANAARVASSVTNGPELCIGCGQCNEACPAGIDIPYLLKDGIDTFREASSCVE